MTTIDPGIVIPCIATCSCYEPVPRYDMINHIWKLRSRAIPYIGIQVKIGHGILSKCPNGQGNGFCPSQMFTIVNKPE